jgi:hypothetical protein
VLLARFDDRRRRRSDDSHSPDRDPGEQACAEATQAPPQGSRLRGRRHRRDSARRSRCPGLLGRVVMATRLIVWPNRMGRIRPQHAASCRPGREGPIVLTRAEIFRRGSTQNPDRPADMACSSAPPGQSRPPVPRVAHNFAGRPSREYGRSRTPSLFPMTTQPGRRDHHHCPLGRV